MATGMKSELMGLLDGVNFALLIKGKKTRVMMRGDDGRPLMDVLRTLAKAKVTLDRTQNRVIAAMKADYENKHGQDVLGLFEPVANRLIESLVAEVEKGLAVEMEMSRLVTEEKEERDASSGSRN